CAGFGPPRIMDALRRIADATASAQVRAAWGRAGSEGSVPPFPAILADPSAGDDALLAALIADAEERWDKGGDAPLELYSGARPDLLTRPAVCRALLMIEAVRRTDE